MVAEKIVSQEEYDGSVVTIRETYWRGETFTMPNANYTLTSIYWYGAKLGSPPNDLVAEIYAADVAHKPTGAALSTGSVSPSTVSTSYDFKEITMTSMTLTSNTEYCLVLRPSSNSGDIGNCYKYDLTDTNLSDTMWRVDSINSGSSWTAYTLYEYAYQIWGTPIPTNNFFRTSSIAKNVGTITDATLQINTSLISGSIASSLSANGGSNWEAITNGVPHHFTNTGTDLRLNVESTAGTISVDNDSGSTPIIVTYKTA